MSTRLLQTGLALVAGLTVVSSLSPANAQEIRQIRAGETLSDAITPNPNLPIELEPDVYRFRAVVGDTIVVNVLPIDGSAVVPNVILMPEGGVPLAAGNFAANGTAFSTGVWNVVVTSPVQGEYEITLGIIAPNGDRTLGINQPFLDPSRF